MFGRNPRHGGPAENDQDAAPKRLKDAIRQVRIESAERTNVVIELHDAEVARLELLNEALDPIFAEVPDNVDLFDRGVSKGETPRLWIDVVAYVMMGRDKRVYRFVQDTRNGRKILLETPEIGEMTEAVTRYVAGRLVERERSLAGNFNFAVGPARYGRQGSGLRTFGIFVVGVVAGIVALIAAALFNARP